MMGPLGSVEETSKSLVEIEAPRALLGIAGMSKASPVFGKTGTAMTSWAEE